MSSTSTRCSLIAVTAVILFLGAGAATILSLLGLTGRLGMPPESRWVLSFTTDRRLLAVPVEYYAALLAALLLLVRRSPWAIVCAACLLGFAGGFLPVYRLNVTMWVLAIASLVALAATAYTWDGSVRDFGPRLRADVWRSFATAQRRWRVAAGVLLAILVWGAIRSDILQNATLDAANDRLIHWYQSARARTFANVEGIQLTIFTDYKCPVCRFLIPRFQRAATAAGAGLVQVAIKDYPLDAECNDQIPAGMKAPHPGACAAAIAAKIVERARRGAAQTFAGWLYANQAVLTKQMIRDHLAAEGLIAEYETMQAYGLESVRADVSEAGRLGVYSTPALVLNGVTLPSLNAAGLEVLLRYEVSRTELR